MVERLNRERPGDASLLLMLGDALVEDQQLDRAIPVLEQAVKAPDALPHAPASLGRAYVQAGRYEESLPFLQAAPATDEDGDVHYQLARAYQALQRPAEAAKAMAVYQQRSRRRPPRPTPHRSRCSRHPNDVADGDLLRALVLTCLLVTMPRRRRSAATRAAPLGSRRYFRCAASPGRGGPRGGPR